MAALGRGRGRPADFRGKGGGHWHERVHKSMSPAQPRAVLCVTDLCDRLVAVVAIVALDAD